MEKIIVGRNWEDLKTFGERGTVFIGKHIVGTGEESHLTNPIHMDVVRPHIVLIAGKRGSGKSYTAAVIAEEITKLPQDIRQNLSILMVDTMGIYWSMRSPNEKDRSLLKEWGLKPHGINMRFLAPKGYLKAYKDVGVRVDQPITVACGDMTAEDWIITFGFSLRDEHGVAIERIIKTIKRMYGSVYSLNDIIRMVERDKRCEQKVKNALVNRFLAAREWGIFEKMGTPVRDMFQRGIISVIDVSHYARTGAGWSVRGMLVGLLARKIFQERLMARKGEEFEVMGGMKKETIPMVWIMADEFHQFAPAEGETAALEPMLTLIKEGREPGISLVMITQRPDRLHETALAQADLVISHRLTSQADIEALRSIMQTYMLEDIKQYINTLPRQTGSAIIMDDNSERIFTAQIRPRFSWHAGGTPTAIKKKGILD